MKRMIVGMLALLASPAAAQTVQVTPDWRAISFMGEGDDEALALIDLASLRRPATGIREIRAAMVSERPGRLSSGKSFSMTQVVYRFDCKGGTYQPVHTEAWSEKGRVVGGDNDGPARDVERGTILADLRDLVCDETFSHLRKVAGVNPIAPSLELIVQRRSLVDSRGHNGWQRLTDAGDAPERLQYFAERGSVITDSAGRRLVSTMVLIEKGESGITRVHYLVRIDCKARTGETIYAQAFGGDGRVLSEMLLDTGPQPLEPGRMAGALELPVCRGDWSSGAPEIRLPDQLAREAFR
ncbi:hypothetical protein OF829_17065 [Sphingomonas sp. LB-2]|uniref:hypothetical protein n=1 Tax=Sphingomonas caeni TaxID=2984949 RepID=UPI00222F01CC|nr:hypothetical protein [Sphingomonas caeni]MCW3848951.1 hypothetical protein [Sphingomonas caeni]